MHFLKVIGSGIYWMSILLLQDLDQKDCLTNPRHPSGQADSTHSMPAVVNSKGSPIHRHDLRGNGSPADGTACPPGHRIRLAYRLITCKEPLPILSNLCNKERQASPNIWQAHRSWTQDIGESWKTARPSPSGTESGELRAVQTDHFLRKQKHPAVLRHGEVEAQDMRRRMPAMKGHPERSATCLPCRDLECICDYDLPCSLCRVTPG
ncbi:hypothetical protein Fraau_1612 [Frateuria aurantia DSM 6220]|uniref:Uncharacterized protein n=1 Tax=Frateuria aurantia (strain ATCC 33424 / DSM 6220 / KCTC 2777 / LMG 1558 / NBRC 3245 / NCIMB 13370) TaxID=767434 RepID=H8L6U2_FRAAD|nr:hypothetical protein Fraau_1612 [Frateuria aurantia DSM 6220]